MTTVAEARVLPETPGRRFSASARRGLASRHDRSITAASGEVFLRRCSSPRSFAVGMPVAGAGEARTYEITVRTIRAGESSAHECARGVRADDSAVPQSVVLNFDANGQPTTASGDTAGWVPEVAGFWRWRRHPNRRRRRRARPPRSPTAERRARIGSVRDGLIGLPDSTGEGIGCVGDGWPTGTGIGPIGFVLPGRADNMLHTAISITFVKLTIRPAPVTVVPAFTG